MICKIADKNCRMGYSCSAIIIMGISYAGGITNYEGYRDCKKDR